MYVLHFLFFVELIYEIVLLFHLIFFYIINSTYFIANEKKGLFIFFMTIYDMKIGNLHTG